MADPLEKVYEKAFGSRTSKGQLYAGFLFLIVGVILALAGIVLFQLAPGDYDWRKAAIILASLSAPSIFLGIFWALPSKVSMRIVAGVGAALCVLGTLLFSYYYPLQFNAPGNEEFGLEDRTGLVIGIYAVGVALLLGGTFTSLIGYYVSRITVAASGLAAQGAGAVDYSVAGQYQYDIPDSVIERDIELAEKRYKYSWGGEGSAQSQTGIQLNVPDQFEAGVVVGGKGIARSVQLDSPQVDDATKKLRGMRPAVDKSISGKWAEDSTQALLEFRKKKEALEQTKAARATPAAGAAGKRRGFWARVWAWVTGKSDAPKKAN